MSADSSVRRTVKRVGFGALGVVVGVLAVGSLFGCCVFSAPRYSGPKSDHFDGERFFNPGVDKESRGSFFKWMLTRDQGPWREYEEFPPGPPPPRRVGDGELRVTFVNHATVLVQMDGLNILTDPQWSWRASPVSFAGPHRRRPPGIRFEDLPPIDVVLISHNHYDHLDLPTLKRLQNAWRPKIFAGLGNKLLFDKEGIGPAMDLDWWQSVELPNGTRITSVPVQHFANRGLCDRDATLWTGFAVHGKSGYVYCAGDTGMGPHFKAVREKFGPPRLALLPIGAFRPEWFMGPVHTTPRQAAEAHLQMDAHRSVAIHFGTFPLADDGQDEPVTKLQEALKELGVSDEQFWVLGFGEGREVPRL